MLPARVTVVEVGPRDGLQNEAASVSTADKIRLVDLLAEAGCPVIEVSAFVSPRRVPQMADAAAVFGGITRRPGVRYAALVPNLAGLERAHAAGVGDVAVFAASTDTFSERNINQTIAASLAGYEEVCARAHTLGMRVRGYVSTAFGCPFEGEVAPSRVADVADALVAWAPRGRHQRHDRHRASGQVPIVVEEVRHVCHSSDRAALPRHARDGARQRDGRALQLGVGPSMRRPAVWAAARTHPGATGNLATEDLVYMLDGLGLETGLDLEALVAASSFIESRIGHPLPSRVFRAVTARRR
jgi:hydroxymethylglutaryl-CoA lyase